MNRFLPENHIPICCNVIAKVKIDGNPEILDKIRTNSWKNGWNLCARNTAKAVSYYHSVINIAPNYIRISFQI